MDSAVRPRSPTVRARLASERCVRVSGSRYEIGYQLGCAQRAAIQRFLADRMARVQALLAGNASIATLGSTVRDYLRAIEARLPGMAEELHGLARGAGITTEDAYLLQLRRELVGYRRIRMSGDCTTFARLTPGSSVLGQTIDLNGDMERELTVLEVVHEHADRAVALASFTGLAGYLGMNDRGLCIGLSLVLGGEWRPGIPGYMAIRHLLDEASTVEECVELLRGLPLASSRALVITDGMRLVSVEYILNDIVVLEGEALVHANHFLHPRLAERDELNAFARTSSLRRFDACTRGLGALPSDAGDEAYFEMLATPPIYVRPNGDIRRECTVGMAVMRPDALTLAVAPASAGAACRTDADARAAL